MKMAYPTLDSYQIQWAYEKWCTGYTQLQIAEALNVCDRTVRRVLKNKERIRPILKYERKKENGNTL